jgi:hypothetical protein
MWTADVFGSFKTASTLAADSVVRASFAGSATFSLLPAAERASSSPSESENQTSTEEFCLPRKVQPFQARQQLSRTSSLPAPPLEATALRQPVSRRAVSVRGTSPQGLAGPASAQQSLFQATAFRHPRRRFRAGFFSRSSLFYFQNKLRYFTASLQQQKNRLSAVAK